MFTELRRPIIALRMDECSPGGILTPSPHCFVYEAAAWDFEEEAVGKRFAQLLMHASTNLKLRLMREAKMSAVSLSGEFSWKEVFAQANEGIQRRNRLLFQNKERDDERPRMPYSQMEQVPGAMLRRLLILTREGVSEDVSRFVFHMEVLGTECHVCVPEEGNPEETIAKIKGSDGVVVLYDEKATRSRSFFSAVERAVEGKCLAVVYTGVQVTDQMRFMFATEHLLTVNPGGLADSADRVHYHLHGSSAQMEAKTFVNSSSEMGVVGGFMVSLFFGVCGLGLAWLFNFALGAEHSLPIWGRNAFLGSLLITTGIVIEGYFKKLEEPLFLPPEERFGHRFASTAGGALLFAVMVSIVAKVIGALIGYEIEFWRWVLLGWAGGTVVAVPIVLGTYWKTLKATEGPRPRTD